MFDAIFSASKIKHVKVAMVEYISLLTNEKIYFFVRFDDEAIHG